MDYNLVPESTEKYVCDKCDYYTSRKSHYDRHITTDKHKRMTKNDNSSYNKVPKGTENYFCKCGKEYKHRQGLWKHNKKCVGKQHDSESDSEEEYENIQKPIDKEMKDKEMKDKDLIMMLINDNKELRNLLLEQCKETTDFKNMMMKVIENGTTHNTTNNNVNSHNKAFNLQFFLNETCKDAMNITDFVESIQLQLSDLEKMGEIGYVEGISNIIVKNLNALDVSQRPVHCTDKKRETIYIKDQDKWEKDDEQKKIRKVIKKVANKNAMLIQQFKEKHPDYNKYHSKYSDQYHKLIIESFGGSGNNDLEKEDKIIRNIAKNITVDKDV